ncbi:FecR domain-containing protein [Sphingomonas sp. RT2P30]|uniref:FecR family protein n=1 Tax=Parasphingomonas halimpatiens TaxID=3096162 RepID=UPI002FC62E61
MARSLRLALGAAVVATASLALGGVAIGADNANTIGINAVVYNNVRLKSAGAPQAHVAVVRERVGLGDEVQTGGRSQLQVLLLDKTVFTVGSGARVTIDRFVYDPVRGARSMSASVVKGAFRFMSGRTDRPGTTSINTPIASIGVRGTIVEGVVGQAAAEIAAGEDAVGPNVRSDPATASLILLRGPGARTQGRLGPGAIDVTAGGRTVAVTQPMRAVFVPAAGQPPIGPFLLSERGYGQLRALLFPLLAQRLGMPIPGERPFTPYGNGDRDHGRLLPLPPGANPGYPSFDQPGGPSVPFGTPGIPDRFPDQSAGSPAKPAQSPAAQSPAAQSPAAGSPQPSQDPVAPPPKDPGKP